MRLEKKGWPRSRGESCRNPWRVAALRHRPCCRHVARSEFAAALREIVLGARSAAVSGVSAANSLRATSWVWRPPMRSRRCAHQPCLLIWPSGRVCGTPVASGEPLRISPHRPGRWLALRTLHSLAAPALPRPSCLPSVASAASACSERSTWQSPPRWFWPRGCTSRRPRRSRVRRRHASVGGCPEARRPPAPPAPSSPATPLALAHVPARPRCRRAARVLPPCGRCSRRGAVRGAPAFACVSRRRPLSRRAVRRAEVAAPWRRARRSWPRPCASAGTHGNAVAAAPT